MRTGRAVLAACLLLPAPLAAQATLGGGDFQVQVAADGVLLAGPPVGLQTVDGPQVQLPASVKEWWGVIFDADGGHADAVAAGSQPDWAHRAPVEPVSFEAGSDRAVSVVRAGDLQVRTEFSFDATGPYLLAAVSLQNTGARTLRNVLYSREWPVPAGEGFTLPDDLAVPAAPDDIARRLWLLGDLPPGGVAEAGLAYRPPGAAAEGAAEVPLELWTSDAFPTGLVFGKTNGISFGDYDGDGFTDVFACAGGTLWHNVAGHGWEVGAELDLVLPETNRRYGSSFGDYDLDGLPDIGTEPRAGWGGDECLHLLHNLGAGPTFVDVATDPAIVDVQPCHADTETLCWGDVDGDGWQDLFVPVYPEWVVGGPGNFFLHNLGPTGPAGEYHFTEMSAAAGLDNPPGSARPEGAQYFDVDADGDLDLYSNGTLYQDNSQPGVPHFDAMTGAASGIGFSKSLDEGAAFFDYDGDGDQDLAIVYTAVNKGVRIWEGRGDGTFFAAGPIIDSPSIGLDLGLSIEDWDNDGDLDFTTRQVFRRNQLVETGERHFTVATTDIPANYIDSATPAWGDWDHDGDLDCALGNWLKKGHFYENVTYAADTPPEARRYVRIRVMRDDPLLPQGTETEYGARVELQLHGDAGPRRIKFVSSSNGYLNQDEYVLTFALPPDPAPDDPLTDWLFDVVVDFPQLGDVWRVDRRVNPLLGAVPLAELADREITVFRSGRVRIDGCESLPVPAGAPLLATTGGGLAHAGPATPLPAPVVAPGPDHFVGLALQTGAQAVRIKELLLDGQLDAPVDCSGSGNLLLWDVTAPGAPVLAPGSPFFAATSDRNHRTSLPVDLLLEANRSYRLVARVKELRETPFAGPLLQGAVTVLGGLSFADSSPCDGAAVAAATPDASRLYLAARLAADLGSPWTDLGAALAGAAGPPHLLGSGTLEPLSQVTLALDGARPAALAWLVLGGHRLCAPFKGGLLVPVPDLALGPYVTDAFGALTLSTTWPPGAHPAVTFYAQQWIQDATAPAGYAASNAVSGTTPW